VARAPGDGEIFGPCGAAALYRTADFRAAGGFDERYFCYCEDVDLAFRLRRRGRGSVRAARAVIRHAGSGISGRSSDFTLFHGHRNRIWTFFKNTPGAWLWVLLPYHLLFNALYMLLAIRRGFPKPIWRAYRAAWRGLPEIFATRRAEAGGVSLPGLLPAMAWTPWSPWRRELRPLADDPQPDPPVLGMD
jgi:GT2 family glycosyltransferase